MATCPPKTIDSNSTGLRFAIEHCLRQLLPSPVWKLLEPNSYSDFGQQIATVARNPINPSRQRKKGVVTDMDATAGFQHDLTQDPNLLELTQSFMFAYARERGTTRSLRYGDSTVSGVADTTNEYTFHNLKVLGATVAAGGTGYKVGDKVTVSGGTLSRAAVARVRTVGASGAVTAVDLLDSGIYGALPANPAATSGGSGAGCTLTLSSTGVTSFNAGELVLASGFGVVANNGIKTVVGLTGGVLEVTEALTNEAAPPALASLQSVGIAFEADDIDVAMNGSLVRLVSSTVDFTAYNLLPGSWLFVGGDDPDTRFANNIGFGRISEVAAGYIELDKVSWSDAVAEDGTGKTIHLYWGTIIRNEPASNDIVQLPVQFERTLGKDTDGTMSEYSIGCIANEYTLNVAQAAIVTVDMAFVACEAEYYTGAQGLKAGTRPAIQPVDAYNTTDNFSRIKLSAVDPASSNPVPLFEFCTDLTLTINNNASANKAVGKLGAIGMTAGTFEVGGEITAYFSNVAGPIAVRTNPDMTIDYILVKDNKGLVYDLPLISLGNGAPQIEQDQPITLPLETNAAESKFGHTLLIQSFPYLPDLAG